jgi:hypothetical protein
MFTIAKWAAFGLLLSQALGAMATTVTYSKYEIRFSPNTTGKTNCIQQLPPLYFSSAKTNRPTPPTLSVDRPEIYHSMRVIQRDVSHPQLIKFSDEVRMAGVSSPIILSGTTDRANLSSHGRWSYMQGQCAGTFAMTRLSTRR